ncbi:hypothetical protein GYMLUDRAFT_54710 [Collybiopsis luxurians FD-317 M1]|nr:hypothetical protein GYMLUDRAFT_54710 [Collybiopsis luxurians FD-317 M1]
MSSLFSRPESPPPRAPSPDYSTTLTPLPIRRKSPAPARPSTATGSNPSHLRQRRPTLRTVHSDTLRPDPSTLLGHDLTQRPSKGILKPSPPPSPTAPSSSCSTSSLCSPKPLSRRRSLQLAVPYLSPPPSPTLSAAPPPVPPIPTFVLTDKEGKKSPLEKSPVLVGEKPQKRQSRAAAVFSLCTSRRSVAVCTA